MLVKIYFFYLFIVSYSTALIWTATMMKDLIFIWNLNDGKEKQKRMQMKDT